MDFNCFKKIGIALSITLALCFVSCQKENDNSNILKLTAPSGEKISNSFVTLTKELSYVIEADFNILNIEYADVDVGYIAKIIYELSDGTVRTLIRTNFPIVGTDGKFQSPSIVRIKSGNESGDDGHPIANATCAPRPNCNCCDCNAVYEWDMINKKVTFRCSPCGGDCSLTITAT